MILVAMFALNGAYPSELDDRMVNRALVTMVSNTKNKQDKDVNMELKTIAPMFRPKDRRNSVRD